MWCCIARKLPSPPFTSTTDPAHYFHPAAFPIPPHGSGGEGDETPTTRWALVFISSDDGSFKLILGESFHALWDRVRERWGYLTTNNSFVSVIGGGMSALVAGTCCIPSTMRS